MNKLTFTVDAPSLTEPLLNSISAYDEITVDLVPSERDEYKSINVDNSSGSVKISGVFPPGSEFYNIIVEGPGSEYFKMYDVDGNIVSDASKAFKIVLPLPNIAQPRPSGSSGLNTMQISAIISAVCFILIGGFFISTNIRFNSGSLDYSSLNFTSTQFIILIGVVGSIILGGFILSNIKSK